MDNINEIEKRLERLERHVGTSSQRLEWKEYVEEELSDFSVPPRAITYSKHERKASFKWGYLDHREVRVLENSFGGFTIEPLDEDHIQIRLYPPDEYRGG